MDNLAAVVMESYQNGPESWETRPFVLAVRPDTTVRDITEWARRVHSQCHTTTPSHRTINITLVGLDIPAPAAPARQED